MGRNLKKGKGAKVGEGSNNLGAFCDTNKMWPVNRIQKMVTNDSIQLHLLLVSAVLSD